MTKFIGTTGADDYSTTGTSGNDIFNMWQGGNDDVFGDAGRDDFRFGDSFNSSDFVDGGADVDRLILNGDYSSGLTLDSTDLAGVERLRLLGAQDYNITISDSLLTGGEKFVVNAPVSSLSFDGSAETDARFTVYASAGDDDLKGGDLRDKFYLGKGGEDTVNGGDGDDRIDMGASLDAGDNIDGGGSFAQSFDQVFVKGDYSGANAVVFTDTTLVGIEKLRLAGGFSYDFTTADGTVDSFTNLTLIVDARQLGTSDTARIDGSAEADSNFTMKGGAGNDEFIGGAFADVLKGRGGDDMLQGGAGLDDLTGGDGSDTFVYTAGSESTGAFHDFVADFDASEDFFDTTASVGIVASTSHAVSFGTFDTDISNAVGDGLTGAYIITANGGDQIGHKYLVINNDGDTHYNSGTDYVIDITFYTGTITTANFI